VSACLVEEIKDSMDRGTVHVLCEWEPPVSAGPSGASAASGGAGWPKRDGSESGMTCE
jgi:hypothetical protein